MRKMWAAILALIMLLSSFGAFAEEEMDVWQKLLLHDNTVIDRDIALQLVDHAMYYTAAMAVKGLEAEGFTIVAQDHYDKAFTNTQHTCAWTLAKRTVNESGRSRILYLIDIRGTYGYEWQSNFDFAPSHSEDTQFAENFAAAAMDVYFAVKPYLDQDAGAAVLVTGYSRGAAAANLLGVLLDEDLPRENVYCYTFATPATVRGEMLKKEYNNIFNFINTADIVPMTPPAAWGYGRAGRDILLQGDAEAAAAAAACMDILTQFGGGIESYYTVRHALDRAGTGEDGMTAFELMSSMVSSLSSMMMSGNRNQMSMNMPSISAESDLAPLQEQLTNFVSAMKGHMPMVYRELIREASLE